VPTPVTLAPGEADQLRVAGWTEAQIAAGKRKVSQPCLRCGGSGHLAGFRHVDGGQCFRCHSAGVDPRPTVEYAPSVRAKLDQRAARRRKAKQDKLHAAFDDWRAQRPAVAAALERADADIRAWETWGRQPDTTTQGRTAKPHTPLAWDPFLGELTRQLRRQEPLSDRQAEFYVRRVAEIIRQNKLEREQEARRVPAPQGTVTFVGTVATIRSQPGHMGRAELKMLVIAEAADGGGEFRVWCTVPRRGGPCGEGDRITLTATLQRSERDPSFAFGKHPRLAVHQDLR
jgi:hypothetical protein